MGEPGEKRVILEDSARQLGGGRGGGGNEGSRTCVSLSTGLNLQPGGTCARLPQESHGTATRLSPSCRPRSNAPTELVLTWDTADRRGDVKVHPSGQAEPCRLGMLTQKVPFQPGKLLRCLCWRRGRRESRERIFGSPKISSLRLA